MPDDVQDFTDVPPRQPRRLIPIFSYTLEHIADVDPGDDLEALLESGQYELRVSHDSHAYLIRRHGRD